MRLLLALLLLTACQHAAAQTADLNAWPANASPREIGYRVAGNWLARPFIFEAGATDRWGSHIHYAEVATWYGALTFARAANDTALARRLIVKFDDMMRLHGAQRVSREEGHVDFSIFGALPLEMYLYTKKPEYRRLGLEFADRQWAHPAPDGISAEARYWVDDMYMLPLLQLQAYRATGKREYLDRTALTMQTYLARLQQPDGLFHHGEGSPFNWARGNGWIAAGMAELLTDLPPDHPRYPGIMAGYRRMMAALRTHQSPEGLWRQLVDRPELWLEGSGSAMLAFALIAGVKRGWLDNATYSPVARRAWLGLTQLLDVQANVRDVCVGTGKALGEVGTDLDAQYRYYVDRPRRTGDLHGQAPMLWAATALLR
jgi:rhamnogalacturonyl hydrolase YesR